MTTTSLKLSESLKERIIKVAAHKGQSAHAYMVSTIEKSIGAEEQRREFVDSALAARRAWLKTGKSFSAEEVFANVGVRVGVRARRGRVGSGSAARVSK
jgi:predicted transcriptional regulator